MRNNSSDCASSSLVFRSLKNSGGFGRNNTPPNMRSNSGDANGFRDAWSGGNASASKTASLTSPTAGPRTWGKSSSEVSFKSISSLGGGGSLDNVKDNNRRFSCLMVGSRCVLANAVSTVHSDVATSGDTLTFS